MTISITGHWHEVAKYCGLNEEHIHLLHENKDYFESNANQVVMKFYNRIAMNPILSEIAETNSTFDRLIQTQKGYFINMFSDSIDLDYIEYVKRVGAAHARINLSPDWYLAGVNVYLDEMYKLCEDYNEGLKIYHAFSKRIIFDTKIAIQQYDRLKENNAFKERTEKLASNIVEDIYQFIQISKGTGEKSRIWIQTQESIQVSLENILLCEDINKQHRLLNELKEEILNYHNDHQKQMENIEELSFIIKDIETKSQKLMNYAEKM